MAEGNQSGERWGTRIGVILAVAGSAVGLGNFLRFPGLASQYGGGAFMIPYFVAFFILGLPLAWAEWSLGRYGGTRGFNSSPGIFMAIGKNRAAPYFGVLGLLIPVIIYMYYVFIESWCLGYAWQYFIALCGYAAPPGGDSIKAFIGMDADGAIFADPLHTAFIFLVICFVLNFILIYRGLSRGIEWFCRLAMPALVVCGVILLVRVLTLGTPDPTRPEQSILGGLGFMWNPATPNKTFFQSLADIDMWLAAAGQIFFSLSVGFGVIITYSSYLRKDDDVALSALTAASGNGFCEVVLGGLITIPAAFVFLGAAQVKIATGPDSSSFDLGFKVLPRVFETMPAGTFFGFLFFFLLFLAAVTSSLSMLQPAIAFLEEGLGLTRKSSVALLGFITLIGAGFITYFSQDQVALDTFDFWIGSFALIVLATVQIILFGWVLGIDKGMAELEKGAEIRLPRVLRFVLKFVAPAYLLLMLGLWVFTKLYGKIMELTDIGWLSLGFIAAVAVLLLILTAQASARWRKTGMLDKLHEEAA